MGRIHGSCPEKPVLRRLHGWKDFDSNYLRCHALLTAFHFPLETTWSCKQYRKERYWGQQFWQMHGKGHFGPTDRNDQNGHSGPPSKLVPIPVGPNRNGPFHLSWGANRNYRNFGLNGKRPTSDKRPQKFHTDDASLPRSEWCSRLVENLHHPIRSTTQIWVVTRHQYGISVTVSQTSFRGETTSGGRREMSAVFSGYSRLLRRET